MSDVQRFTLTEQHIKLLRAANVRWGDCEFGAPAIDCKRPYGNSNVYRDILHILYGKNAGENDTYSDNAANTLYRLHRETETALQVILATGSMEPGEYVAERYTRNWRSQ